MFYFLIDESGQQHYFVFQTKRGAQARARRFPIAVSVIGVPKRQAQAFQAALVRNGKSSWRSAV